MPDPRLLAAQYGVAIELADLGDWGSTRLIAEYDPSGPTIRVNERVLPTGSSCIVREHLERAVAHELYHHREAIGEVPTIADRAAREAAADAYADALLNGTA